MLGVIIDTTSRKHIEERLKELNETLEARVGERTAALERSQQALQQAQKMEAIGNLTGGIAHDFNNLLQGVTGCLDLIRRNSQDAVRVHRWAEAGLEASERGAKLTAQLLAFSRSQKLELKPVDLTELLLRTRDLLARTLGPAVHITINPEGEGVHVMGDETQLELAVLNLAINARDAMPNGGELVIATRRHQVRHDADLAAGDYIEITVTDSGSGMPAEILTRAFDPFFTTKGVGKGTGLGLSQVYAMARQAGGIARLVSKPGEGTTARIFLRTTRAGPQPEAARDESDRTGAGRPAIILIVDDDVDVRRFLADSLDAFGYKTVQAENAMEGLAALEQATPDMMIVDYAMPGMNGAEMAQKARVLHPTLPIVFASGYAETSALENVADARTLILRKPFRINELQDAVTRALAR
jgi:signal transduction histidine kinase/CheY-like chemotaxis protein